MKNLLLAILLFCSTAIYATPVRVTGTGITEDIARQNALKNAVDQSRSVIVSESESVNGILTRNEIINHSSAYVENYKLISIKRDKDKFIVELDVVLKDSAIADRILLSSKTQGTMDGQNIADRVSNFLDNKEKSKRQGLQLIDNVMRSFPENAFLTSFQGTDIQVHGDQNAVFNVYFTVKWNDKFIDSLDETLKATTNSFTERDCENCYIRTLKGYMGIIGKQHPFFDSSPLLLVFNKLNQPFYFNIKFFHNGILLFQDCRAEKFNFKDNSQITIGIPNHSKYKIEFKFSNNFKKVIAKTDAIQLELASNCKNT